MIRDIKDEYHELVKTIPESYKVKKKYYQPKSLTEYQIVCLMKQFVNHVTKTDGLISYDSLELIIGRKGFGFKISKEELEEMIRCYYNDENDYLLSKKDGINFSTYIYIIDTLKREKIQLVTLNNIMNYFIMVLLIILVIIYLYLFY